MASKVRKIFEQIEKLKEMRPKHYVCRGMLASVSPFHGSIKIETGEGDEFRTLNIPEEAAVGLANWILENYGEENDGPGNT